jgi:quinol monooxygenase YgiN
MNKVVIVMTAKAGKTREAMAAVKALTEYTKSKHGLKTEVYMQLYGVAGTIYVIGENEDMVTAQAVQAKLMADDGYWALAQKMAEVMVGPPTITLLQPI